MKDSWARPNEGLGAFITGESRKTLDAYGSQPTLVEEHANLEEDTARGGYAHRQLFELIQNSADALTTNMDGGRLDIHLTENYLYCADNGEAIYQDGVKALMFSHMSPKRGTSTIGRFGLGFKSVLGVTDNPEFFSRSGSFRFDRDISLERIDKVVQNAKRYPALRLPVSIDPDENREKDDVLHKFMDWAVNIVRLPLKRNAYKDLAKQMDDFPPEFLLFVEHVHELTLNDESSEHQKVLKLENSDGEYHLHDDSKVSRWRLFKRTHHITENAQEDRRSLDDSGEVPICWAAPLDRSPSDHQHFWAFFPTNTPSLLGGILNAPWKTNEDRQNLLPGPYNDELIEAAAEMIAEVLPQLATKDDPVRHLDALPRRQERGDLPHSDKLRTELFSNLRGNKIIPNQNGDLCATEEIQYPPEELTKGSINLEPFERWAAYPGRPPYWLHHRALNRNRLATIDRLFDDPSSVPRASIAEWLEALIDGQEPDKAIEGSKAAIQTAAAIDSDIRKNKLGEIILTADGKWQEPDPDRLFLPTSSTDDEDGISYVHSELALDRDTLSGLKELGLEPISLERRFNIIAGRVLSRDFFETHSELNPGDFFEALRESHPDGFLFALLGPVFEWEINFIFIEGFWGRNPGLTEKFWELTRELGTEKTFNFIRYHENPRWKTDPVQPPVRDKSGRWRHSHSVLLPGNIVPGDGSRDQNFTVDMSFHEADYELLRKFGVTDVPREYRDLSSEPWFSDFLSDCRAKFQSQPQLPGKPQPHLLDFVSKKGPGPLQVLKENELSDEGKANYTDALLSLDSTYEQWIMKHKTQGKYGDMRFASPVIEALKEHGQIRTPAGIVPFKHALGPQPENLSALYTLLKHAKADLIKKTFGLIEPTPEFKSEEDPVPLIDVWPGIEKHLPPNLKACRLIRCERILIGNDTQASIFHAPDVYLVSTGDEDEDLQVVSNQLPLDLSDDQIKGILDYESEQEINNQRSAISEKSTDEERLLAAVGEADLRQGLPGLLLNILENQDTTLSGINIAGAAIATYHSGALKQYKWALSRLDPPKQWAGSERAIDFVCSLGFSSEWAGERNRKREPFLEIEGPYSLPALHHYQEIIVDNVHKMLRSEHTNGAERIERSGMISLPTGSGKTRVAVQAIVEAMCSDSFKGGILWVADRDELCEQAVESWRQVWSSIGAHGKQLRISRMWRGQPRPLQTNDLHVVVATRQTLYIKLSNEPEKYKFLKDFKLIVFDEAHRSIAPTFTSVMQDIGLTRRREESEPFLLGLTATPYRGYNEDETKRLVNRYGRNRLDAGAFKSDEPEQVIHELQEMRVLAQADHKIIEGGIFSLSDDELKEMESTPWLPQNVEKRIAGDSNRTERIIEAYKNHVERDWPALIFATSVEHAETVAALLNTQGIKSRAVSGYTDFAIRRKVVEEFRRGDIKALVNYGVFREGFDAPKTRSIIVARPVYSPNLYFQMIGRGLRGIKNGGNDRCLILNVRDNIENFKQKLAFTDLDWLWSAGNNDTE